ncbi:MAG: beta-N-acetylglucosaminidase domain-containing protein [Succinivibrio sp.]
MAPRVPAGIIEGFYGTPYSERTRSAMMRMAAAMGLSFYAFAPKNYDPLRKLWDRDLGTGACAELDGAAAQARSLGLDFAFGISPLGLSSDLGARLVIFKERVRFFMKMTRARFACLLFDDVPNSCPDLGERQNAVIRAMEEALGGEAEIWVCPTTYSDDPILTRLFGPTPPSYFRQLQEGLGDEVRFFWTGPRVLSEGFSIADVERADDLFRGRTVIWHNYPVNDGKARCGSLYLDPFKGMAACGCGKIRAVAANPMTEGVLSMIPMATLAASLEGMHDAPLKALRDNAACCLLGPRWEEMLKLASKISRTGLERARAQDLFALRTLCASQRGSLACQEILSFLDGRHAFDPACLT